MRITGIRLRRLRLPLDPPFEPAWDPEPRRSFEATLVYVDTDEGVTGIGSGDTMDGFERYAGLFVGHDPLDIERHVRVLETIAFHGGRYWPVEAALWDLAGKAKGVPTAQLLGGASSEIPVYASTAGRLAPGARAESALALRELGFRALKVRIDKEAPEAGLAAVTAVREAVGADLEIMVDLNQGWRMPGDVAPLLGYDAVAALAARLRELDVLWLEEPLAGEDVEGLARLRADSGCASPAGRWRARPGAGRVCRQRRTRRPPTRRRARRRPPPRPGARGTRARGRPLVYATHVDERNRAPHQPPPGGGRRRRALPRASFDPPGWTPERRDFMLAEPVRPSADGLLAVPDRPGLGFELDEEAVERYTVS